MENREGAERNQRGKRGKKKRGTERDPEEQGTEVY